MRWLSLISRWLTVGPICDSTVLPVSFGTFSHQHSSKFCIYSFFLQDFLFLADEIRFHEVLR